jgi:hypothetical protein
VGTPSFHVSIHVTPVPHHAVHDVPVGVARDVDHADVRLADLHHIPGLDTCRHTGDPVLDVAVHPQLDVSAQFLQLQVTTRVIVVLVRRQHRDEVLYTKHDVILIAHTKNTEILK